MSREMECFEYSGCRASSESNRSCAKLVLMGILLIPSRLPDDVHS